MKQKETIRTEWLGKSAENDSSQHWGKAAEKLRRLQFYRAAKTVFATPHESLHQARINCLADGKNLLMPGPGIREGFFLLPANSIPFSNITMATTYKGLDKFGHRLKEKSIPEFPPDLLLTDSLVIDEAGGRIGDGNGYFDLCCALLQQMGGLKHGAPILTFIEEDRISSINLPQDRWDIKMNGAISSDRILKFDTPVQQPKIFWEILSRGRIKRIDPLWKLYKKNEK